jgi:tRNA nucleotidyltransferase/poly(A) polymerase
MNLKDKNLYYIGGVVRDEILGTPSFDIDLTYNGNAIEFAKNLPDAKIVQINEPFGTIRIKLDRQEIDIASTRSEIYPQKGHLPVVDKIGGSLKEDVMRRDFTINAMAKSTLTGEIIDYTGGLEDIKTKTLRVLHNNSFIDDPTRILRMLKFAVRFGFEPDSHTKKLQDNYLANINYDMSYKRLKKELIETFNLNKWSAFEKFVEQGIYKLVAPQDFELPKYNFSPLVEQFSPDNCWIIYIGLLPDISNLPLTKGEKQIVDEFNKLKHNPLPLGEGSTSFEICKTFKNIPLESVIMYSTINHEIVEKYLNELKDIDILIDGNNLKTLGIEPSPKYQECFDYILKHKIENSNLKKEDEINLAKEFFNL